MIPKFRHKKQYLGHRGAIFCLQSDGEAGFYSCGGDGLLVHWSNLDQADGEVTAQLEQTVYAFLVQEKRQNILFGKLDGSLTWVQQNQVLFNKKVHQKGIFDLVELDEYFLSLGGDGQLGVWSKDQPGQVFLQKISEQALRTALLDPLNAKIYVGGSDGHLYVLNAQTLQIEQQIQQAHQSSVFTLCKHPEQPVLFSGGRDNMIRSWNMNSLKPLHAVPAHAATVNHLIPGPQGVLFSAGRDKEIRIWDINSLELQQVLKSPRDNGHVNSVNRLWWSDDLACLCSAGDDRSIIRWEILPLNS